MGLGSSLFFLFWHSLVTKSQCHFDDRRNLLRVLGMLSTCLLYINRSQKISLVGQ